MQKKLLTWKFIYNNLLQEAPVMLLYVLESKGSSPGRLGFFMAVSKNGEMNGSIGGGIMEHKFTELAKEKLQQGKSTNMVKLQVHDKSVAANQSGMICSGEQTIFMYSVKSEEILIIKKIIDSLEQFQNGQLELSPGGIYFSIDVPSENFYFYKINETDFLYREKTSFQNHLHIIGGGHCSLALAELMSKMDFYIHIYEERIKLNTIAENNFADSIIYLDSYENIHQHISEGGNQYVVIMTVGYRTDAIALKSILDKQFAYIGMLGSKNKIDRLFGELLNEGVDKSNLAKVHAPIGIAIKSQSTEEIAVSIAAEIIQVKNAGL